MGRNISCLALLLGLAATSGPAETAAAERAGQVAPKPLYRDPVFDGAADPIVHWNPHVQRWWMFYTNRRANVPGLSGVAWVHGTHIGIAESADGGATWTRVGDAEIALPENIGGREPTHWAPDVITAPDGTHHMFLTVVPGIFEDWQHPRDIVHLTSADLRKWNYVSKLKLSSDRVIDACVAPLPGGGWRMWYNDERDGKSIHHADSRDLKTWTDRGKVVSIRARGEGPAVFTWRGRNWMLVDTWRGLAVYRSLDLHEWTLQPTLLLDQPGKGADDGVNGGHAGVVVSGGRVFCFYFTHPGRAGTISPQDKDSLELRRSSIQVVELFEHDGWLTCDRDAPTRVALEPPGPRRPGERAATERIASDAPIHALAHDRAIEAVFLHRRGEHYYLFINHGTCCRGINSTYHIRVGRSEKITGPYVDRAGKPLLEGGGTLLLESEGPFIGPGHASIMQMDGREWFGCHFYDASQNGRPTYALRPLTWNADGWPVVCTLPVTP